MKQPNIQYSKEPVLEPKEGCPWADTMVLNPALFMGKDSSVIHMLFRSTGPFPEKNLKGLSDPYPIFLGYAKSEDGGNTFQADFSRPALAPNLAYNQEEIYILNEKGKKTLNYVNGCMEDPRIFEIEGQWYLSVAGRIFPPGAYWEGDKRSDNLPEWAMDKNNKIGQLACKNDTVTVLYRLDLEKLAARQYEDAFSYIGPLTDGNQSDNRDVFLFPKKLKIHGKMQYVMLHRPEKPSLFQAGEGVENPAIMLAAAEHILDLSTHKAEQTILAKSLFPWEEERIGASFQPFSIGNGEWLVSYHGKQVPDFGYTQSFMIVKEQPDDFPKITSRVSERIIYAKQKWELPDKFLCPCIFTTGAVIQNETLIMGYGAADQKIGIAKVDFKELVEYVKSFDAQGKSLY